MRAMRSAKGRAVSAAACALRRRLAATIFMAEVIFCVDFTLAILVFNSLRPAIPGRSNPIG